MRYGEINLYHIQVKVQTMLQMQISDGDLEHGFLICDYKLETSKYDPNTGTGDGTWIISKLVHATDFKEAITNFWRDFVGVWSRIQFVGQAYCEPLAYATLLVQKAEDENGLALLIHTTKRGATGLAFGEKCKKALDVLCSDDSISDNVIYYLGAGAQSNDLTLKMMSVFAALENLFNKPANSSAFFEGLETVYGSDLKEKYWGKKDKKTGKNQGLRHRLFHGDYFKEIDADLEYQNDVYLPLIRYFNKSIFGEDLIREKVVNPQRLPWQNSMRSNIFFKRKMGGAQPIAINDVLDEIDRDPESPVFSPDSQFNWVDTPEAGDF